MNTPDVDGMTPLHWAAHWDELELVKTLLAAGANAKAENRYGVTPLHEASLVANVPDDGTLVESGRESQRGVRLRRNAADDGGSHRECRCRETSGRPAAPMSTPLKNFAGKRPIMFAAPRIMRRS